VFKSCIGGGRVSVEVRSACQRCRYAMGRCLWEWWEREEMGEGLKGASCGQRSASSASKFQHWIPGWGVGRVVSSGSSGVQLGV
jgi:hypothetical protein